MKATKKTSAVSARSATAPGARLWHNAFFNIFWFGQTLSVLGDSFAAIAIPLLVLQATGSVAQMGLVTATMSIGQIVGGIFAGPIADRLDRRKLLIFCDTLRFVLYSAIPLGWWLLGPQLWLIFFVVAIGACLGMTFQVTYVTAVANLVDGDQIIEANSRLQITYSIAFVTGPVLAGLVTGSFGATTAISLDAASFVVSALSLLFIRLRSVEQVSALELLKQETAEQAELPRQVEQKDKLWSGLLDGIKFVWYQPVLRPVMVILLILTFLSAGMLDVFIFHVKHDLLGNDTVVGIVFGLASIGGIVGGVVAPSLRRRLGFGPCWIGGFVCNSLSIALIGWAPNLVLCCLMGIIFTFTSTIVGVCSLSLRQEITPDHLLGRVTSVFWTVIGIPGPLGAALFTALSASTGASKVMIIVGLLCVLTSLAGLFTAARQRYPERRYGPSITE
jgi:MFS family permease